MNFKIYRFFASILLVVDVSLSKPISILLLNSMFPGHLFPLVGLGEELVKRGHNVTLCSTVMEGSTLLPFLPESVGVNFVSAGDDYFTWSKYMQIFKVIHHWLKRPELVEEFHQSSALAVISIRKKLESIKLEQFDIIVCDISVLPAGIYFAENGMKVIIFSSSLPTFPAINPGWRYPLTVVGGQYRDIGFIGRLFATVATPLLAVEVLSVFGGTVVKKDEEYAKQLNDISMWGYPGVYIPHIVTSVIGIETPTILTPLRYYVGPVLRSTQVPLDKELTDWLNSQQNHSVLYIGMGTTGVMSRSRAEVIMNAVLSTGFNAVWALRKDSIEALDDLAIDSQQFLIRDWVPQQTVLQHKAIKACILHCGLNSVQESLYNSLPVVCLPHFNDHFQVGTAIEENKVGVSMYSLLDVALNNTNVTLQDLSNAIQKVTSDEYQANAHKLSKIMKFAGGAKAAADLVEHHEDIGYNHLIPAFAKHQWTWIQYYNVDVYSVLFSLTALTLLSCCGCLKRCGRKDI